MIQRTLSFPNGIALVAAKKYYFGTGGSVHHFIELVHSDVRMECDIVWNQEDCKSNIRQIVKVYFKKQMHEK